MNKAYFSFPWEYVSKNLSVCHFPDKADHLMIAKLRWWLCLKMVVSQIFIVLLVVIEDHPNRWVLESGLFSVLIACAMKKYCDF